jgi:hypothetical protein
MRMNKFSKISIVVILASMLVVWQSCSAQDDADSAAGNDVAVDQTFDPTVDTIERQLETKRHENLLARITQPDTEMTEFWTDGCSGGLSTGWEYLSEQFPDVKDRHGGRPPWESCCEVHDVAYHEGGLHSETASDSFEQRKTADLELLSCVANTAVDRSDELQDLYKLSETQVELLYQSIAEMMYRAVRLGGVPCTIQPWRWGYGWPSCQ